MAHVAVNAHLLSGEASYRSAGIHGYIYNSLKHLPQADPDLALSVMVGAGTPPTDPALHVLRSRLPTAHPLARILWEQLLAPATLNRLQPDLHHGMAFVTPLLWGGPSVITIYDLSFIRYPQRLSAARRLYLRTFTRSAAHRARRVIAISESGRQEIHTLLDVPLNQIDAAPPGVREGFYPRDTTAFRARHGLPDRFILHVGTLEPRKNLETLVRAYEHLPQRDEVNLVLVGGRGWQTEALFALIERVGGIILPGYVPDADLPYWYSAAELCVYPSVYEGFGIPVIEAASCGTPVVVADTTSLPEAVGPHGVMVPPHDVQAWTDVMAALLDDPTQRARLADLERQHAARYTWANTARQIATAYRHALGEGPV
ncbi:MAG: glycosyltransferase family 4 protein [Chloroflexi bacterium]|nr:glycosyltransferase family 4 protein [Chloroflexota bacterium]